jgi:hypothetical protein
VVTELRKELREMKELLAETMLHNRVLKKRRPVPAKVIANLLEGTELRFVESQRLDAVDDKYQALRGDIARRCEGHTMRQACG